MRSSLTRGLILRGVAQLRPAELPAPDRRHRRSQPHVAAGARRIHEDAMSDTPLFDKVALIGVGLIGSSMAHAMRRGELAGHIAGYRAARRNAAKSARRSASPIRCTTTLAACGARCRSRRPGDAGRRLRRNRERNGAASEAGRDRQRCRLGQRRRDPRCRRRIFRKACISFRRIPSPAPSNPGPEAGFAELFDGRWCILTPPPGADAQARRNAEGLLGAAAAAMSK